MAGWGHANSQWYFLVVHFFNTFIFSPYSLLFWAALSILSFLCASRVLGGFQLRPCPPKWAHWRRKSSSSVWAAGFTSWEEVLSSALWSALASLGARTLVLSHSQKASGIHTHSPSETGIGVSCREIWVGIQSAPASSPPASLIRNRLFPQDRFHFQGRLSTGLIHFRNANGLIWAKWVTG